MTWNGTECNRFRQSLMEGTREGRAHARGCARCAITLHNQIKIAEGLAALAKMETRGPSPALEAAFLGEFGQLARSRRWTRVAAVAGTLAASLAVIFLLRQPPETLHVASKVPQAHVVLRTLGEPVTPAPVPERVRVAHRTPRRAPHTVSPVTDFVAVPFAAPLERDERAQLVRISMPVGTLAAWGFPLGSGDPEREIDADVVVGEDGLARAIRLLR